MKTEYVTCPQCNGTGIDCVKQAQRQTSGASGHVPFPCCFCGGKGKIRKNKQNSVKRQA